MIAWLYNIIVGRFAQCPHKWEIINTNPCILDDENAGISKNWHKYTLQCEHCGNIKSVDIGK